MKSLKTNKLFETTMTWILALCLILETLLIFKIFDLGYKLKGKITSQSDFKTLVIKLQNYTDDLKALEILGLMNRTFLLILLLVFFMFIIFRIVKKEYYKLLQLSTIMIWISSTTTAFYIYVTKDLFYALRSILSKNYELGLPNALYLLARLQKVINTKEIIMILTIVILISTSLAILLNVTTLFYKNDEETNWKKFNASIFVSSIFGLLFLISWNIYVEYKSRQYNPLEYLVINYSNQDDNIYLVGSVNMRKVNRTSIDPEFRYLYLNGTNYEIERSTEALKIGESRKIKVSYNLEAKELLGLKTGNLEKEILIDKIPNLVKNIDEVDLVSLYKYLGTYESKYRRKSIINDEFVGIYEDGNKKYYLVQKLKYDQLSFSELQELAMNNIEEKEVYNIIYLGSIYTYNKKVVGIEMLNLEHNSKLAYNSNEIKELFSKGAIKKVK